MAMAASGATARLRILVVGDHAVGKTSFVKMLCGETPSPSERSTVGANLMAALIPVGGAPAIVEFVDVGGHEDNASARDVYFVDYDGADSPPCRVPTLHMPILRFLAPAGVMLVMEEKQRDMIADVVQRWIDELEAAHTARGERPRNAPVALVCTKMDTAIQDDHHPSSPTLAELVEGLPSLARDVPVIAASAVTKWWDQTALRSFFDSALRDRPARSTDEALWDDVIEP